MGFFNFVAENWLRILSAALVGYILGSISFSIIITKMVTKNKDIRDMGSGNAGFTNVLRSVGKGAAIATISFDLLKGVISVILGGLIFSTIFAQTPQQGAESIVYGRYLAGFCCILGHMFPVFFGFKGGKGVVTAAALILVADWRVFLVVIGIFLIIFLVSKIISVSSLVCAVCYPVVTFCFTYFADFLTSQSDTAPVSIDYVIVSTAFAFAIGVLIIVMHRANIVRILNGTEKKITSKK